MRLSPMEEKRWNGITRTRDIQGVLKGTDTFQSFIFKKLDNLRKFFSYH